MHSILVIPAQLPCPSAAYQGSKAIPVKIDLLPRTWANRKASLLGIVFAGFFATGCGGTPEHPTDDAANNTSQKASSSYAAHGASVGSSFTVNPTEDFNGFNPDVWNSQQSWVECNCGNGSFAEPKI